MAARSKAIEQAAEELYALPPGEFTRTRDERAKALRKDGQRDEADAVTALRKPTVAAWALNQLARRRPKELGGLLAAGDELRAAQEELLAGGDRKAFQNAAAKEREQVAKLAGEAAGLAAEAGERAPHALQEKITETLHAAALDEETAAELRAGRLVREREAIGGFGAMTAAPAPNRGAPPKGSQPAQSRKGRGAGQDGGTTTKDGAARGRAKRAESSDARPGKAAGDAKRSKAAAQDARRSKAAAHDAKAAAEHAKRREAAQQNAERRQRLAGARTDERHARRELDAATKAIEHAETRAEAARTHAEEAKRRAETTAQRLKEARRGLASARKAHARAERALEAAEGKLG